jgi:ParB-like chromosome segregation protein Spo0J
MAKKQSKAAESIATEMIATGDLKLTGRNARSHPKSQIDELQASFESFGITKPILVDEGNVVLVGRGRVEAALKKGVAALPCVRVKDWSDHKKRSFAIAENRLGELSHWDAAILQASVGESEVLQRLFPSGDQLQPPPPKPNKQQPVGDASRYLSIDRTLIAITEREENLLHAALRFYVSKFSVSNGFLQWILSESKSA